MEEQAQSGGDPVSSIANAVGQIFSFASTVGERMRIKLSGSYEGFKNFFPEGRDMSLLIGSGILLAATIAILYFTRNKN